jgi:predicted nuclease with TOPRIM domain
MSNPIIQTDIAEILGQINGKLDTVNDRLNKLEVSQARIEGKIETVDEKLSGKIEALNTKVEQLDKRISNSELTNRGILIGIVVIIFGGIAKLFGFIGNS